MTARLLMAVLIPITLWGCSEIKEEPVLPPDDDFDGIQKEFVLGAESEGLPVSHVTVTLLSETGTLFSREAYHSRTGDVSTFYLVNGLANGVYRLLYVKFPAELKASDGEADDGNGLGEFGLGSRIEVSDGGIKVIDTYNKQMKLVGSGTHDDPFIISSSSHIFRLMMVVNDYDSNKFVNESTCFRQVCDIDMKSMSRSCDAEYGWMPIGADTNTPFKGKYIGEGHTIKNLIIKRPKSAGIGLFGYIYNGAVDSLNMKDCSVVGQLATGTIAGAIISGGDNVRGTGSITNCTVEDCVVTGNSTSSMVGGVIGALDMHAKGLVANCEMKGGTVSSGI